MNVTPSPDEALEAFNAQKIREYVPAIAYSAIVIVLGVVGNAFTVAYYGFHEPRTSTNFIITALGKVDLISCIVFSDEIIKLCFFVTFKNVALCKSLSFCNQTLVIISGCIMLLVAVDRYRHICAPFAWQLSVKCVRIVIACIVVFSSLHSLKIIVITDVVYVNVTDPFTDMVLEAFYCVETLEPGMQMLVAGSYALDMFTFILIIGSCAVLYALIVRAMLVSKKKFENKGPRKDHSSSITCDSSASHVNTAKKAFIQDADINQDTNVIQEADVIQDTDFVRDTDVVYATNVIQDIDVVQNTDIIKNLGMDISHDTGGKCHSKGLENQADTRQVDTAHKTGSGPATGKDKNKVRAKENNILQANEQQIDKRGDQHAMRKRGYTHSESQTSGQKSTRRFNKDNRTAARDNMERKLTLMTITITAASIISFIPHFVFNFFMTVIMNYFYVILFVLHNEFAVNNIFSQN